MSQVTLAQMLAFFSSRRDPRVVATGTGHDVMEVKFKGAFPVHKHETTDDFFSGAFGRGDHGV